MLKNKIKKKINFKKEPKRKTKRQSILTFQTCNLDY